MSRKTTISTTPACSCFCRAVGSYRLPSSRPLRPTLGLAGAKAGQLHPLARRSTDLLQHPPNGRIYNPTRSAIVHPLTDVRRGTALASSPQAPKVRWIEPLPHHASHATVLIFNVKAGPIKCHV